MGLLPCQSQTCSHGARLPNRGLWFESSRQWHEKTPYYLTGWNRCWVSQAVPFRAAVIASPVPEPAVLPSAPSLAEAAALGSSPDALPVAVLSSRRSSPASALVLPCIDGQQPGLHLDCCVSATAPHVVARYLNMIYLSSSSAVA